MNRRSFMSMFGAGLTSVAVNPVHFLAPVGGWRGGRTYSFKDVSGLYLSPDPLVLGALWPDDVIWLCRVLGETDAQLCKRFSVEAETRRLARPVAGVLRGTSVVEATFLSLRGLA
jgi:hypothetical protein